MRNTFGQLMAMVCDNDLDVVSGGNEIYKVTEVFPAYPVETLEWIIE